MFREVGARNLAYVLALVAFGGKWRVCARRLANAGLRRKREIRDLRTGIVVIVFPVDAVALRLHQSRDRIANRRSAAVPHMQRAGRICGNEFDDRSGSFRRRDRSERVALVEDTRDHLAARAVGEKYVNESRAGHLNPRHPRRRLEGGDQRRRQLTWLALESLG